MATTASPLMPVTVPAATPGGDRNAVMSSMMSVVPSNLFDDVSGISPDGNEPVEEPIETEEAPVEDTPELEAPAADEPGTAAEPADAAAAAEPTADQPPAAAEQPVDDLPEGVRKGKDSKGKEKFFLEPARYATFHANHKLVQQTAELFGEPVTAESLDLRNEALLAQERLYSTLESGEPQAAVSYIIDDLLDAHKNGEVGLDPTIPFAETIYESLKTKAPQAWEKLQLRGARDLLNDMYDLAANDDRLRASLQNVAATLANVPPRPANMPVEQYIEHVRRETAKKGLPFFTKQELLERVPSNGSFAPDPRDQRIAELESQISGNPKPDSAEQFRSWDGNHRNEVNTAIFEEAVKPSLTEAEAAWKTVNRPDDYKRLVTDPLNREVANAIAGDSKLNQRVNELRARAQRATSEQVRQQLSTEIRQLVVQRAKFAVDRVKAPILETAARALKGLSDTAHERRTGAQQRTAPAGPSAPVRTSPLPQLAEFKNGVFDSKTAARQAAQLLAGLR